MLSQRRLLARHVLLTFFPFTFLICTCVGCNLGGTALDSVDRVPPESTLGVVETETAPSSTFKRPFQRVVVVFSVHRVSAKRGSFGATSRLWEIATVPLPDAASALRLAANGFRAAVGRESDRAALLGLLKALEDTRIAQDQILPDELRLVQLELGPCAPWQSVFYYGPEGGLRGMDFADARARIKIAFGMRATNLKEIWLRLVPELEEPPGPPKWVVSLDGRVRQEPELHRHTFDELGFSARIPEGGFLVLAPTPSVYEKPLLGRPFFLKIDSDADQNLEAARESLYIISPIIRSYTGDKPSGEAESF